MVKTWRALRLNIRPICISIIIMGYFITTSHGVDVCSRNATTAQAALCAHLAYAANVTGEHRLLEVCPSFNSSVLTLLLYAVELGAKQLERYTTQQHVSAIGHVISLGDDDVYGEVELWRSCPSLTMNARGCRNVCNCTVPALLDAAQLIQSAVGSVKSQAPAANSSLATYGAQLATVAAALFACKDEITKGGLSYTKIPYIDNTNCGKDIVALEALMHYADYGAYVSDCSKYNVGPVLLRTDIVHDAARYNSRYIAPVNVRYLVYWCNNGDPYCISNNQGVATNLLTAADVIEELAKASTISATPAIDAGKLIELAEEVSDDIFIHDLFDTLTPTVDTTVGAKTSEQIGRRMLLQAAACNAGQAANSIGCQLGNETGNNANSKTSSTNAASNSKTSASTCSTTIAALGACDNTKLQSAQDTAMLFKAVATLTAESAVTLDKLRES
jgi:hypothetical protein